MRWVQFYWHDKMRTADAISIEVYRNIPAGNLCTIINGISDDYGVFNGLSYNDYSLSFDTNGKVIAAHLISY